MEIRFAFEPSQSISYNNFFTQHFVFNYYFVAEKEIGII